MQGSWRHRRAHPASKRRLTDYQILNKATSDGFGSRLNLTQSRKRGGHQRGTHPPSAWPLCPVTFQFQDANDHSIWLYNKVQNYDILTVALLSQQPPQILSRCRSTVATSLVVITHAAQDNTTILCFTRFEQNMVLPGQGRRPRGGCQKKTW